MSAQEATLELFLDGAWTEVPLHDTPAEIERGTDPYSDSWPAASTFRCDINNKDLSFDPAEPESALYGVAGRNTLARLELNGTTGLTAEVAEWSAERSMAHHLGGGRGRASTGVHAEGVLGRISSWTDQLKSPMYSTYSGRSTSVGHWHLEDNRLATQFGNSLPGGRAATVTGPHSLGEDEAPLGAASSLKVEDEVRIGGYFEPASATAGWQIVFSFRLEALPGSTKNMVSWRTANGYQWVAQVTATGYTLVVLDQENVLLLADSSTFGDGREPTEWTTMRVKASQSGGTVNVEVAWFVEGVSGSVGYSPSFTGIADALYSWAYFGATAPVPSWLSHVQGVTGGTDNLDGTDAELVMAGYLGELTTTRFLRLCAQRGINAEITGDEADGTAMGPQRPNTFVQLLKEIKTTEDGRIDDQRTDIGLAMRTRRDMIAQEPALELTFPGDVSPPFRRLLDNKATANHVTASDAIDGEAVVSLDSGPMSTQDSPDGAGEVRKTVEVSVSDVGAGLAGIAGWHLAKGTIEAPRYSTLVINLVANPHLAAGCAAVALGDMITLTGFEPDLVRLLVTKVTAVVGRGVWRYEFATELYEAWRAGAWDAARYDLRTATIATAAAPTATTLALGITDDEAWSSTSAYDLTIGGELVGIPIGGMAARAGSAGAWTQTATGVTRSKNGIRKTLRVGTPVHVANPGRYAR